MADDDCGPCFCCCWVLAVLAVFAGIVVDVLFVVQVLGSYNPDCYLHALYIPALNKTDQNSTDYSKIYVDLRLVSSLAILKFHPFDVTFYYPPNVTSPIANFSFPAFTMRDEQEKHLREWVEVSGGMPWAEARAAAWNSSAAAAVFRLEIATTVTFFILYEEKRMFTFVGDVSIDSSGNKVHRKKDVWLKPRSSYRRPWWLVFLAVLCILASIPLAFLAAWKGYFAKAYLLREFKLG